MEVPDFEDDLIWQPFTDVYFCTNSAIGVYSFLPPWGICCQEAAKGVSDSLKDNKIP